MAAKPSYPSKKATALDVVKDCDLSGKYIMVTGANTGIGFETARALANRGAHVIMACRNTAAASDAKNRILQEKGDAEVSIMKLDCSDLDSVETCAEEFLKRNWPLHCLILNAGVFNPLHRVTDAGFEATFQINHLAQFLLTRKLEGKLIESAPSRVVVVASDAEKMARLGPNKITWEVLSPTHKPKLNPDMVAYGISKFCNVLFAKELNKRLSPKGVTAYSLHPGLIKTEIGRNSKILGNFLKMANVVGGKNTEQGAATTVYCTTSDQAVENAGGYFSDCKPKTPTQFGRNEESAAKLWELSEQMLDHYKQSIAKQQVQGIESKE